MNKKINLTPYIFILPALIITAVFIFIPTIASFYLSFTRYDPFFNPEWIGVKNYIEIILRDKLFWIAIKNTFIYAVITVPIGIALSLLLAVLITGKIKLQAFFRTTFFIPAVTSILAVSVIWKWLYAGTNYGLINYVLLKSYELFGIGITKPINWLLEPEFTLPSIIVMSIWGGLGYNMIIFINGLLSITPTLYEAAEIDGATPWQKFVYITLPLLKPVTLFVVVTSLIASFQVFDQVYIMTGSGETVGGVLHSALTIVTYLYEKGFQRYQMGYACAIAYIIFAIIFFFSMINFKFFRTDE